MTNYSLCNSTEIVIIGYGSREIYPSIISGEFMGYFYEELKYSEGENNKITSHNRDIVAPFAQSDVVNTFMYGYDDNIINDVKRFSEDKHWGPIIHTIAVAPKEELAHMAEKLVNLTSFRRKFYFDNKLNYNFYNNYYEEGDKNENVQTIHKPIDACIKLIIIEKYVWEYYKSKLITNSRCGEFEQRNFNTRSENKWNINILKG